MAKELTTRDEDFGIDVSDIMVIVMMVMMVSLMSTVVPAATQALQAQAYTGLTDSRVLKANYLLQWVNLVSNPPYAPWITATFHNDGPQSAFIAINNPDESTEIASGEDLSVDMSGGDRRMEFIFYRCSRGETASVRVVGKY